MEFHILSTTLVKILSFCNGWTTLNSSVSVLLLKDNHDIDLLLQKILQAHG